MTARTPFRIAIPARHDSSRLPGKPLIVIAGRPLIEHVWRRARAAGAREVIIATDDERIARTARAFGADVCLTRADHVSGTDRLGEVVEQRGWDDDDIVVNLQGDEPLTPPAILAQVADNLAAHADAAIATLATPFTVAAEIPDPGMVKVVTDARGYALYFSRAAIPFDRDGRHQPSDFWRHVGIYAYRCAFLRHYAMLKPAPIERRESLEQLRALWHGYRIHVAAAVDLPGPGIDTPADIERVASALEEVADG